VQEVTEIKLRDSWSEGKRIRSHVFAPSLLLSNEPITGIAVKFVHSEHGIDQIVSAMRMAGTDADEKSFPIDAERLREILKHKSRPRG
jgi:hypothetical protein